jgi:hypothetical protein
LFLNPYFLHFLNNPTPLQTEAGKEGGKEGEREGGKEGEREGGKEGEREGGTKVL